MMEESHVGMKCEGEGGLVRAVHNNGKLKKFKKCKIIGNYTEKSNSFHEPFATNRGTADERIPTVLQV